MGGVLTTFDGNRLSRCVTETCDQVSVVQNSLCCLICTRNENYAPYCPWPEV
jgi:hypothetical protein